VAVGSSAAVRAQEPPAAFTITVTSRTPNAVEVDEHLVLAPNAHALELRIITRPCMVIENLRIDRDGVPHAMREVYHGPWITLRDSLPASPDTIRLAVRYNVWLGGSRTIPLVHPSVPATRAGDRGTVDVIFPHDSGVVEFPHMTRQAPTTWSASYVAIPAFVKVGGFAFPCDRLPPAGDDGGLIWRFRLLVLIMLAWVPLYLAWARRTTDGDER
jgi:hypothetical protein